jgi:HEAT repeat protein
MSTSKSNPYRPFGFQLKNYVKRNDIFGNDIMSYLKARVNKNSAEAMPAKNVLLLGDAGTGKTWLLHKLRVYLEEKNIKAAYFDMGDYHEDADSFLIDFQNKVDYRPSNRFTRKGLLKALTIGFPLGVSLKTGDLFTSDIPVGITNRLEAITEHILVSAKDNTKPLVIIFDQYGRVSEIKGGVHIVRHLSYLIRESNEKGISNLLLIFAMRPERKGILEFPFGSDVFDPTFVKQFSLGELSRSEAKKVINTPTQQYNINYAPNTVNGILNQVGTFNPYFLQLACYLIWEKILITYNKLPRIIDLSIAEIEKILEEGQAYIFNRYSKAQQEVLKIIAQSHPIPLTKSHITRIIKHNNLEDYIPDVSNIIIQLINNHERPLAFIASVSGYRLNHDLFADYILDNECDVDAVDVAILKGFLEYSKGLYRIAGFKFDKNLLDKLWVHRHKIIFSDEVLNVIAISILDLDGDEKEIHFQWFSALRSSFTHSLIRMMDFADNNIRKDIIKAMGMTGDKKCHTSLFSTLLDDDDDIRKLALDSLASIGSIDDAKKISMMLHDENDEVRIAAIQALYHTNSNETLGFLVNAFKTDDTWAVKQEAVKLILQIEGDKSFDIFKNTILNSSAETKVLSIHSLGQINHAGIFELLIPQLRKRDPYIRENTIIALGKTKDERSIPYLSKRINDRSNKVARASLKALAQFENPNAMIAIINTLSSKEIELQQLAYRLLLEKSGDNLVNLLNIKKRESVSSKILKCNILGQIGTDKSFSILQYLSCNKNDILRAHFIKNLVYFKNSSIRPYILKAFNDKSMLVIKTALNVVLKKNIQDITESVKPLANHPNTAISKLATKALATTNISESKVALPTTYRFMSTLPKNIATRSNLAYQHQAELMVSTYSFPSRKGFPKGLLSALFSDSDEIILCSLRLQKYWHIEEDKNNKLNNYLNALTKNPNPKIRASVTSILPSINEDYIVNEKIHHLTRIATINKIQTDESGYIKNMMKALKKGDIIICESIFNALSQKKFRKKRIYKMVYSVLSSADRSRLKYFIGETYRLKNILNDSKKILPVMLGDTDETYECNELIDKLINNLWAKYNEPTKSNN